MSDLIKALQIFLKYENPNYPTHCEHDKLYVFGIDPKKVSQEDIVELSRLGFEIDKTEGYFYSYRFGSC